MPLYKHKVQLTAPLKELRIVPQQPPEPPAPTFSELELKQQVDQAKKEGFNQAQQQMNQQIAQLRQQAATLQSGVLDKLEQQFESLIAEVNTRMPQLIMALLKRVLINVTIDADTMEAIISEAMQEISGDSEPIEVRLSPHDHQLLKLGGNDFASKHKRLSFTEDPSLKPGDCLLYSRFGIIDAGIETKLQKIAEDFEGKS